MSVQYWYRSQLNTSFEEITKHISIYASGSETINELPGQFKLKFEPYKNINGLPTLSTIDINIGDEILITDNQIDFIAYGKVFDPGRNLLTWDKKNNKAICDFNIICMQSDFSSIPISKQEFTNTNFFEIVNFIMEYTDNTLGESVLGKYTGLIDNFDIENYVIEKKTARESLTELCQNYDLFWTMKHKIKLDSTKKYIIERYIEINTNTGSAPSHDSIWYNGISNENVRTGTIQNPISDNIYLTPRIPADKEFKIQTDASVLLNYLELNCKVYESNTGELYRYSTPALPEVFDYELDGYAGDVIHVGIWTKDTVKVESGSTSSIIRLQSRYCTDIEIDDIAHFPSHEQEFFTVTAINKVDSLITELSIALSFTPTIGEEFEIVGNTPIYKKESEINYSSKGCIVDTDKKSFSKIKFLDLSEANVSQKIIVYYKRIKDLPFKLKNDESISLYGLKYKEIKIDDDLIFTENEIQELASKLLVLKPQYKFSFVTQRYGLAPIGLSLPVKIDNFITETFILNSMEWEHLHNRDRNKKSVFIQNLDFSTYLGKPEKIIERFRKQKKSTSTNIDEKDKNIQIEKIKANELITWSYGAPAPSFSGYTFTNANSEPENNYLTITWNAYPNALNYYIQISLNSSFTDNSIKVNGYTGNTTSIETYDEYTINNSIFYARFKVQLAHGWSEWSNTLEIEKIIPKDYVTDSNTLLYYPFQENTGTNINDETANNRNSTIIGSSSWQSGIISGDTSSLYLNGNSNTATSNFAPALTDFTARVTFRFNTGDKSSKATHILVSRYDTLTGISTISGADIICEFDPTINKFLLTIYQSNTLYRTFEASYTALENVDYSVQFAFKLNHSGSNLFEICVNGTKLTTSLNSQNISNISSIQNSNIPIMIGAYRASSGTYYRGQFRALRVAFDNRFRTESEALTDYNNLFS